MADTFRLDPELIPNPSLDPDRQIVNMALEVYREREGWYWPPGWFVTSVEFVEVTQVEFIYSTGEVKPGGLDECQFRSALCYLLTGETARA